MSEDKHPGGRSPKFNNWIKKECEYKDFINNDFKTEKELSNFIVRNIHNICEDIFNDKVIKFEVDFPIEKQFRMAPRGRRIDIIIYGENNNYLIELKSPKFGTESRAAIGQILDYGREFENFELSIITSKFDINTAKTIKYFNLPIRYIYTNKHQCAEFIKETV